jgi:hypothetical protein
VSTDLAKYRFVVFDKLLGRDRCATDDISNWFCTFAGEPTVRCDLSGRALVGNEPIREAAPLHHLLGLLECYRNVGDLAAQDLGEYIRKLPKLLRAPVNS